MPITKTAIIQTIERQMESEGTSITRKAVGRVLALFEEVVQRELQHGEDVNVLGLVKLRIAQQPARKARTGVHPFTGETHRFKAKPATTTVRARVLRGAKDSVASRRRSR